LISEAVILAGGFGTRFLTVVKDIPKPMAAVSGKPFLGYILDFCIAQGIQKVILAVGYKYEVIQDYFGSNYQGIDIEYAIENEPLGTGGAIKNALQHCKTLQVLILNGDSFLEMSLVDMNNLHETSKSKFTLVLKPMKNFERYGAVEIDKNDVVVAFKEKEPKNDGLINAGIYIIDKGAFMQLPLPEKFSFETDFLMPYLEKWQFKGFVATGMFIDIGIPEDYEKAQGLFG